MLPEIAPHRIPTTSRAAPTGFCVRRQCARKHSVLVRPSLWRPKQGNEARQTWAMRESPGNLLKRRTAWWGWKDSNLQPDCYELEGLEPQPGRYERTSSAAQKSDFPAYGTKGLKVPARHAVLSNESPARPGTGCRRARAPR